MIGYLMIGIENLKRSARLSSYFKISFDRMAKNTNPIDPKRND